MEEILLQRLLATQGIDMEDMDEEELASLRSILQVQLRQQAAASVVESPTSSQGSNRGGGSSITSTIFHSIRGLFGGGGATQTPHQQSVTASDEFEDVDGDEEEMEDDEEGEDSQTMPEVDDTQDRKEFSESDEDK